MFSVEKASPEAIVTFIDIYGWLGWVDGEIVCFSGFRRQGDRLWAYLDVFGKCPALPLVRAIRHQIENAGEDVYVMRDDVTTAPRLLRLLGFARTDEVITGKEIWKWHRQHSS